MAISAEVRNMLSNKNPMYTAADAGDAAAGKLGGVPGPGSAVKKTQNLARDVVTKTREIYDVATRGKHMIGHIGRQKTMQELVEEAETTVRRARVARRTAREEAEGNGRSVEPTAVTGAQIYRFPRGAAGTSAGTRG